MYGYFHAYIYIYMYTGIFPCICRIVQNKYAPFQAMVIAVLFSQVGPKTSCLLQPLGAAVAVSCWRSWGQGTPVLGLVPYDNSDEYSLNVASNH